MASAAASTSPSTARLNNSVQANMQTREQTGNE
jgi:hypothetical protein